AQADAGADRDDALGDILFLDQTRAGEALLELGDLLLDHRLLVLRVVVLRVLGDVAELAGMRDALRDLAALVGAQGVELLLEAVETLGGEQYVLHGKSF